MNSLQLYKNNFFEVAATLESNRIFFEAEKVARCLGIVQKKEGIEYVRWKRVNEYLGNPSTLVGKGSLIPESWVYKLAFKASNEVAEVFQDWLANEVIPMVRETGGYISVGDSDNEATIMAKALLVANKTIEKHASMLEQQRNQLVQQQPKVVFANAVETSETTILVRELAKLISQSGIDMGEKRMFQWLRERGYLIKRKGSDYNTPTQRSMDMGLFEVKVSTINRGGNIHTVRTPKVTGKGKVYFINKMRQDADDAQQKTSSIIEIEGKR